MENNKRKIKNLKDFLALNPNELFDPSAQKPKIPYKEIVKGLRYLRKDFYKYDLRKDLAPQTKRKIDRVVNEYISLISQPAVRIVTPRKKNRKKMMEFTGQSNQWRKAIVPVTSGNEKIAYKNGKPTLQSKFGAEENVLFNIPNLIKDSDKEVGRVLKGKKFDCLYLICGSHLLGAGGLVNFAGNIDALKRLIKKFMNQYTNFPHWMRGVKLIRLRNQNRLECKDWSELYETKRESARKRSKKKRAANSRR